VKCHIYRSPPALKTKERNKEKAFYLSRAPAALLIEAMVPCAGVGPDSKMTLAENLGLSYPFSSLLATS